VDEEELQVWLEAASAWVGEMTEYTNLPETHEPGDVILVASRSVWVARKKRPGRGVQSDATQGRSHVVVAEITKILTMASDPA